MDHIARFTLAGTASGVVGTLLGGITAYLFKLKNRAVLGAVLDFAAGLMLAVVMFDLLPHAFSLSPFPAVMAGVAAGVAFVITVQAALKRWMRRPDGLLLTAVTIALGIAIHNVPEGLAIGAGLMEDRRFGLSLAFTMFLHDIPEGFGVGLPLRIRGKSVYKTAAFAVLAGLPTGAGAFIGAVAGTISNSVTAFCLSVAGGAMLYLVLGEMMPEAHRLMGEGGLKLTGVCGVGVGIIISTLLG